MLRFKDMKEITDAVKVIINVLGTVQCLIVDSYALNNLVMIQLLSTTVITDIHAKVGALIHSVRDLASLILRINMMFMNVEKLNASTNAVFVTYNVYS